MKSIQILLLSIVVILVAGVLPAFAQFTPSDDAYTDAASPTTNFGAKTLLDVQSAAQNSYILFDLSPLPAGYSGTNIGKATLKLYVNTVTAAGSLNVDFVNGSWNEKTITSNLSPALGGTVAASIPLAASNAKDYVIIDVTSAVQAWLNGTQPNDGLALVGNSSLNATFDSKESTTQSHPPELDIVFAGGEGTITGITTANGSGLTGGGTSGTLNLSLTKGCAANQVLKWKGTAWACANLSGSGTVTSVGLSAPASDFNVTGSPVTSSGTLGLNWKVAPTSANTVNAIVKRDASGNFSAGFITLSQGLLSQMGGNGPSILGQNLGTGFTKGVWGLSSGLGAGSAGVVGGDSNSMGSGGYTAGVLGQSANPIGMGVLGAGSTLSNVGQAHLGNAKAGVWADSTNFGLVATSDVNSIVAYNNNAGAATVFVQNDTTASNGLIFYATAPKVTSNGFPATCLINTHADLGCNGNVKADGSLRVGQDATQPLAANGMVKALVYYHPRGQQGPQIVDCFNSQLAEPAASTPPCGFTLTYVGLGATNIDFGFSVDHRFIQVTPEYDTYDDDVVSATVAVDRDVSPTTAGVITFYARRLNSYTDTPYYLSVF